MLNIMLGNKLYSKNKTMWNIDKGAAYDQIPLTKERPVINFPGKKRPMNYFYFLGKDWPMVSFSRAASTWPVLGARRGPWSHFSRHGEAYGLFFQGKETHDQVLTGKEPPIIRFLWVKRGHGQVSLRKKRLLTRFSLWRRRGSWSGFASGEGVANDNYSRQGVGHDQVSPLRKEGPVISFLFWARRSTWSGFSGKGEAHVQVFPLDKERFMIRLL